MNVLVTGNKGFIGQYVERELTSHGHSVRGFDRQSGRELNDPTALAEALHGCEAVVHLAALPHDSAGTPEQIFETNVLGTWRLLQASKQSDVRSFVYISSAAAFGFAEDEHPPDYFPIDDLHPLRAARPYGLSKRFAEESCQATTEQSGLTTVCLRPFKVMRPGSSRRRLKQWGKDPGSEWTPFWEFGACVDVRDVAIAVRLAVESRFEGHVRALLANDRILASRPSLELAVKLLPNVPVRDYERYRLDPYAPLVDARVAREVFNWVPHHMSTR